MKKGRSHKSVRRSRNRRRISKGVKRITKASIRKSNRKRQRSALEAEIHAILVQEGIEFKAEHSIGRCHVDIFLKPSTIIELNGCYWHACQMCYPQPSSSQQDKKRKDGKRYAYFRRLGMDVILIWEHEVKNHKDRVRATLKAIYDRIQKEEEI